MVAMMSINKHQQVKKRDELFSAKMSTRIWEETPSEGNPYIASSARCHGYAITELVEKCSFIETLYLLFRGELPGEKEALLLEKLMIFLINPGPRHPATRAAMNAGIGKTNPEHILPISLTILGGAHLGAGEIEASMRFLRKYSRKSAEEAIEMLFKETVAPDEGDWHIAPGFGSRYGSIDVMPGEMAKRFAELDVDRKILKWGCEFAQLLAPHQMGWLMTGLAAAVFAELGFQPRYGAGLFQLLSAPGLLAHGMEQSNKPLTAMPFVKDEDYVIEE